VTEWENACGRAIWTLQVLEDVYECDKDCLIVRPLL